jgi:membrane protein DedA with SNARE-associated domain
VDDPAGFLVRHGPALIFGVVLLEQLGLPLAGAPFLLAAGALAAAGRLAPGLALALPVLACLLGDLAWYALGRTRGGAVLGFLCRVALEPDSCVRRTEDVFARHGARVLLVAKFLPGLNAVAPPLSGITRMPLGRFLRWDAAGAGLWTATYVGLGALFHAQLAAAARALAGLGAGAALLAGGVLAAWAGVKWVRRRRFLRSLRGSRIEPEELAARLAAGEAVTVVDLRSPVEGAERRLPGALRLTPDELLARHGEIPRDREIVVYCS